MHVIFHPDVTIFPDIFSLGCFFLIYAEIHYRLPFFPSRYYRKEPEIIADAPTRLQPHEKLPVLLIVKDALLFPIHFIKIRVIITDSQNYEFESEIQIEEKIDDTYWEKIFEIEPEETLHGTCTITVEMHYRANGRMRVCINDNYRLSNSKSFITHFAKSLLPMAADYLTGDLHVHSNYTNDQLEFGASIEATARLAKSMGHSFVGITDHSYDLDDYPDNFLKNDPGLEKWSAFQKEVKKRNAADETFVILPGEEVSCGNLKKENVHFLVYNNETFLPGTGDSGDKWFRTRPDLSINEVVTRLSESAACFASHPEATPPFFQNLLLNRGKWHAPDYQQAGLHGMQIWNGEEVNSDASLATWRQLLLQGKRFYIIAGTDAHGNFNRFRQITKPLLAMADLANWQVFGSHRSLILHPGKATTNSLAQALRAGQSAVTSGPFLSLHAQSDGRFIAMGGEITTLAAQLTIHALSTEEFGPIHGITVYRGDLLNQIEEIILQENTFANPLEFTFELNINAATEQKFYYRVALVGEIKNSMRMQALTNPIWHSPVDI